MISFILATLFTLNAQQPKEAFVPVCDRAPILREYLVLLLNVPCQRITRVDLEQVGVLALNSDANIALTASDLKGLVSVDEFRAEGLGSLSLAPRALAELPFLRQFYVRGLLFPKITKETFAGVHGLEGIYLFRTMLESIEPGAFEEQRNLKTLTIDHASVQEIGPETFAGLRDIEIIAIRSVNLTRIKDGTFDALPNLSVVNLPQCPLTETSKSVFRGTFEVQNLTPTFDIDSSDNWGTL